MICHGSSDPFIMNECDETHTYLSNGDDGFALVYGSQNAFTALDWIGDWNDDPGSLLGKHVVYLMQQKITH